MGAKYLIILEEDVLEQDGLVMVKRNNQLVFSLDKNTNIHNEDEILELDIFTIEGTEPIEVVENMIKSEGDTKENEKLLELVKKYRKCFALNMNEVGCARNNTMRIQLMDNVAVYVNPRKILQIRISIDLFYSELES